MKSNTCPYCAGPYTLAAGGCGCPGMTQHAALVRDAADADVSEQDEIETTS